MNIIWPILKIYKVGMLLYSFWLNSILPNWPIALLYVELNQLIRILLHV
jgi:hypothetical protein